MRIPGTLKNTVLAIKEFMEFSTMYAHMAEEPVLSEYISNDMSEFEIRRQYQRYREDYEVWRNKWQKT